MPAYDRPIVINVDRSQLQRQAVGAVLQFKSNDLERVQRWLDRAAEAGVIEPVLARTYNPDHGSPVWYIP